MKTLMMWLLCCQLVAAIEAELPADANRRKVVEAATSAASVSSQDGMSAMTVENMQDITGVEGNEPAANLFGNRTSMKVTRKAALELSCRPGASGYKIGLRLEMIGCSGDSPVTSARVAWCEVRDGINCHSARKTVTIPVTGEIRSDSQRFRLLSCRRTAAGSRCRFELLSMLEDAFSGSGDHLEKAAKKREQDHPNFVLGSIEASQANPDYHDFEKEGEASKNYINSSYDQLIKKGEMQVYRNSPDDIKRYGIRTGVIGIDNIADNRQNQCKGSSLADAKTCVSGYPLKEYICHNDDGKVCRYVRAKTVEVCTESLVASCGSKTRCSAADADSRGPLKNLGFSGDFRGTHAYPGMVLSSGSNDGLEYGFHTGSVTFNLLKKSNVTAMTIRRLDIDDMATITVNGTLVLNAWGENIRSLNDMRLVGICPGGLRGSDGACHSGEGGDTVVADVNLDITPYLVEGLNSIDVALGVIGRGSLEIGLHYEGYCGCIINKQWNTSCAATNILR